MTWCPHCAKDSEMHRDYTTGSICCIDCGKVVSQDVYTDEPTFIKNAGGGAQLSGNTVRMAGAVSESHLRTLDKGNVIIYELINKYGIDNVHHATNYYQIAVERGFTRGRRTNQVAAACLYIACREREKPFLLIEFSSELGVSVYELGTVYLLLCKLLSLNNHDFVQKLVDPSLFMHRYTSGLLKGDTSASKKVSNTALKLAVSMKRDWIQTGRKPSGICAAAIYVSSVLHGYNFSRADVVRAVHICEATLTKRLIEFENTKTGSLTIEEFTEHAMEFEKEKQSMSCKMPGPKGKVCTHNSIEAQYGSGLCTKCYLEFVGDLSSDASEPPAFQRAELQRLAATTNKSMGDDMSVESTSGFEKTSHNQNGPGHESQPKEKDTNDQSPTPGKLDGESPTDTPAPAASVDETHTLSDIDDSEVSCYLNNEEERRFKKIIWEQMNKEYMQEQAAKEAAAAAAQKLYTGTSEEIREAQALAAAAAEAVASKREKDRKRRALEAKNAKPPQTPGEATAQHFASKKLYSKINYEALEELVNTDPPSPKKKRVEDDGDNERIDGEVEEVDNDELDYEHEMDGGYGYYDDDNANGYDDVEY